MRKFNLKILFFLFPLFMLITIYEFTMYELKETVSIENTFKKQNKCSSLFMRKYLDQEFNYYKIIGLEKSNPEVIIVGSSRVMQFRHEYFNKSFYNAGGLLNNYKDLISFLNLKNNAELIVIGIDPWWFKKDNTQFAKNWVSAEDSEVVKSKRRYDGKKKLPSIILDYMKPRIDDNIGAGAQISNGGFRVDGSMKIPDERVALLIEKNKFIDTETPSIPLRISEGLTGRFSVSEIDTLAFNEVIRCLKKVIKSGKRIIVYLPPFTNESYDLFSVTKKQEEFFLFATQSMPEILLANEISFIPIEIPRDYKLEDTYFIDGIHPSEVFISIQLSKHHDEISAMLNNKKIVNMISTRFCDILFDENELKINQE